MNNKTESKTECQRRCIAYGIDDIKVCAIVARQKLMAGEYSKAIEILEGIRKDADFWSAEIKTSLFKKIPVEDGDELDKINAELQMLPCNDSFEADSFRDSPAINKPMFDLIAMIKNMTLGKPIKCD